MSETEIPWDLSTWDEFSCPIWFFQDCWLFQIWPVKTCSKTPDFADLVVLLINPEIPELEVFELKITDISTKNPTLWRVNISFDKTATLLLFGPRFYDINSENHENDRFSVFLRVQLVDQNRALGQRAFLRGFRSGFVPENHSFGTVLLQITDFAKKYQILTLFWPADENTGPISRTLEVSETSKWEKQWSQRWSETEVSKGSILTKSGHHPI